LTVLLGASFAEILAAPRRLALPAMLSAIFAMIWLGGALRLHANPTSYVADVHLRIVQPNIPQDEKYRRTLVQRNWQRLVELSTRPAATAPTVIIWPEAAPPVLLQRSPGALEQIVALTGPDRVLITGNQRAASADGDERVFYNSLYIFGHNGKLLSTYDKFHLVPFGEYMPLQGLMQALRVTKLVGFPGSFAAGDGPHTYQVPGAPSVGPLICYEILFPAAVIGRPRPGWLVNVTDDSWFGPWAGPRQHLLAARVRAIEEGLPVVRAANTGISAVIDPLGRTIATLGLDQTGAIDSPLPRALAMPAYGQHGDAGFLVLLLMSTGLSWWLARK
jgi:apolipoprotein N-acyltransferase